MTRYTTRTLHSSAMLATTTRRSSQEEAAHLHVDDDIRARARAGVRVRVRVRPLLGAPPCQRRAAACRSGLRPRRVSWAVHRLLRPSPASRRASSRASGKGDTTPSSARGARQREARHEREGKLQNLRVRGYPRTGIPRREDLSIYPLCAGTRLQRKEAR